MSKKILLTGLLSLILVVGTVSVSFAGEINGVKMDRTIILASSNQNGQHEATPGMDPNMQGMDMSGSSSSTNDSSSSTNQHQATPGMDPNMPGMNSSEEHTSNTSEGVNWPVVGGFSLVNLIVISSAGLLKLKAKTSI